MEERREEKRGAYPSSVCFGHVMSCHVMSMRPACRFFSFVLSFFLFLPFQNLDHSVTTLSLNSGSKVAEEASRTSTVLKHSREVGDKNKDVTTLEWNREGTLLATGGLGLGLG